ncbi:MAG: hypothetical protein K8R46_04405 [Pirellulales bacterium]|nr:hypothetical protein [Pirellulales bacterium]
MDDSRPDSRDMLRPCWAVENLATGMPANAIEVEPGTARRALEALRRMPEVK